MNIHPKGRIEAGGEGIGTPSHELIEQRAHDLARQDGRDRVRQSDRDEALAELQGEVERRDPEVPPGDENLTEWNQTPDETGHAAPKVEPEDEANIAQDLVEEGLDEADQDKRHAAAEEEE
ncbi:hypothetical protein BH23VER1_BH23VER1_35760 [soil metagenome]